MLFEPEPHQELDSDDTVNPDKDIPEIPTNFLSPSVREYLELGKSIPGKISITTFRYQLYVKVSI